ncbi:formylglycine-generating enzyme family protein [Halanaerobacter jeridensis]|uniref:Formylglycine-generating enzyme required for sulfatase activity n=1 Tax=Halanaerobacter jeridensis TaxID=706427 RepID=A0A939BN40_9FIRM|nr:SUMF1/EgtB/PvdO family nonheme iron enzyme [Halanaerobacter jeridensis]MBM7558125.1 formylglycine-generating enzyme required for sulfatase activity [Halanaerobacter jeridensis]
MQIKKLAILSLVVILSLGMAGCSGDDSSSTKYDLTVGPEREERGEVIVDPQKDKYEEGTEVTLAPSGKGKYSFAYWEGSGYDGNTDNPLKVTMTNDLQLVAVFTDSKAPSWQTEPNITTAADTNSLGISAKVDEGGTIYYKVMLDGATRPAASEVKSAGNGTSIAAETAKEITISGLDLGTSYDVFFAVEDSAGNLQSDSIVKKVDVSTELSAPSNSDFVNVPAGKTSSDNGGLTLDYHIEMSKYEVTHAKFIEFLNNAGVSGNGFYKGKKMIDIDENTSAVTYYDIGLFTFEGHMYANEENTPVMEVTWYGALAYCNWLSEQEGLTPAYDLDNWKLKDKPQNLEGYRLPTKTEWEYAAHGGANGDNTTYAGSDNIDDVAWHDENSDEKIHPVGQKQPNELGIYDMSGNVAEWTNNIYSVTGSDRVTQNGSFALSDDCYIGASNYNAPSDGTIFLGFRLTKTK